MSSIPLQQVKIYTNIFEENNLDPSEYTLMTYLLGSPIKNEGTSQRSDYNLPVLIYAKNKNDNSKSHFIKYTLNWHDLSHARIGYQINPDGSTKPYIFNQDKPYKILIQEIQIEQPLIKYEIKTLKEIFTQYQIFSKLSKHSIPEINDERFCVFKLSTGKNLIISSHEIINFFYTKSIYNLIKTAILTSDGLGRMVEGSELTQTEEKKWLMTLTHYSKLVDKNQILYFLLHQELKDLFNKVGSDFINTNKLSAPIPVLSDLTIMARVFETGTDIIVLNILRSTHLRDFFSKVKSDDYIATHKDKLKRESTGKKSNKNFEKNAVDPDNTLGTNSSTANSKSDDEIILEDDDFQSIIDFDEKYTTDFTIQEIFYGTVDVNKGTSSTKEVDGTLTTKTGKGGKKAGKLLQNATPDDNNINEFNYNELIEKLTNDNYSCSIYNGSFEMVQQYFLTKKGKPSKRIELFKSYQSEHYRAFKLIQIQKNNASVLFCDIEPRILRTQEGNKYVRNSILLIKSDMEVAEFIKKYFLLALVNFVKTQQFLSSMNDIMTVYPMKIIRHMSNMDTMKRNIDDFIRGSGEFLMSQ